MSAQKCESIDYCLACSLDNCILDVPKNRRLLPTALEPVNVEVDSRSALAEYKRITSRTWCTRVEERLLLCFLERLGSIVTFTEMAREVYGESVWPADLAGGFKVHAHRLRNKLYAHNYHLISARGIGYQLIRAESLEPEPAVGGNH